MPIGIYKDFAACVRANKDKSNPNAYCGSIFWKTEGKSKLKKKSGGPNTWYKTKKKK